MNFSYRNLVLWYWMVNFLCSSQNIWSMMMYSIVFFGSYEPSQIRSNHITLKLSYLIFSSAQHSTQVSCFCTAITLVSTSCIVSLSIKSCTIDWFVGLRDNFVGITFLKVLSNKFSKFHLSWDIRLFWSRLCIILRRHFSGWQKVQFEDTP